MRDLHNNVKVTQTIDPVNATASTVGVAVDRQGFESVEHIVCFGESGDTLNGTNYWHIVLQHSDDNSIWDEVTSAADVNVGADGLSSAPNASGIFATIDAAAEDDRHYRIGYVGGKRYSRIFVVENGTLTTGTPIAAVAVLGHAEQAPVSD